MATLYGLRVRDELGRVILDTTSSCSRILGVLQLSGNQVEGEITTPDFAQGTPWYSVTPYNVNYYSIWAYNNQVIQPYAYFDSSRPYTLKWMYPGGYSPYVIRPPATIFYGVY